MAESHFIVRDVCPVCNSKSHQTLYATRYSQSPLKEFVINYYTQHGTPDSGCLEGANYILEECSGCGLIYQKEAPTDILMAKIYEEWINPHTNIENHSKSDDANYFSVYAHEVMRLLAYYNRAPSSIKVLDFGMGLAKWALMAKAFGCDVYGTEISAVKKIRAQDCGIKVIELSDDINDKYDFINVDQVIEHLRDPLDTLINLKKHLKPDGIIKVCVPDGGDIKKRLKIMDWNAPRWSNNSLLPIHPLVHINCFNRGSLMQLVDRAGFKALANADTKKFPLLIRNNPVKAKSPRSITRAIREEWRYNFNWPPTYLLLRHK
ncbi:MAG: class I SAM-dependent methyltransferase [bacterium]|nr:class I SAM-dependent methyltransferase [bacterium]